MSAPVVFSAAWFERHQRTLLVLLALPLVGRLFRRILAIRAHDIGWSKPIVQLLPHAYTVDNGDGTFTVDVRTHDKFAKRLYYQLRPLWTLFHAWDMAIANPLAPALNVGFDTLTQYPDPNPTTTTCDGSVERFGVDEPWGTLRAGAGNRSSPNNNVGQFIYILASTTSNQWARLQRGIFLFDTSSVPVSASVSSAVLSLWGSANVDTLGIAPDVDIYTSSPASNTTLVDADYGATGSVSQTGGAAITLASFSTTAYNDFTFSATGIGNIVKGGVSKFAGRNANYDVANVAPTWASGSSSFIDCTFADQTGNANDPKLVVTYATSSRLPPANRLRPRVFAPGRAR